MHDNQTVMLQTRRRPVDGVCPRCESPNIVESRHKGLDFWIVCVFPTNVYRCVECYSRFWMSESLFANGKRLLFWCAVVFMAVIAVFLKLQLDAQSSTLNRTAQFIPQFEQAEEEVETELVSTDTPVTAVLSDSGVVEDNEQTEQEQAIELADVKVESVEEATRLAELNEQSEQVQEIQKSNAKRLEKAVSNDTQALASLLKIDMNYRVERWRSAWESGFIDYYLDFYSSQFKPSNGLNLDQWVAQRKLRIKPEKKIDIELSNFDVSFSDKLQKSTVTFDQFYRSANYSERSRKQLVWVKEDDGWHIVSETELN